MKNLLLVNAYESWRQAIKAHDKIQNGLSTLNYQKEFVASLHNSVELFLKQLMIINNDHDIFPNEPHNRNLPLWQAFSQSNDLTDFLSGLNMNDLSAFYSIGFTKLIAKHDVLLSLGSNLFETQLKKLQELRNNETHFYIDNSFLSETDFIMLHDFMIEFYNQLLNNDIFPDYLLVFGTGKRVLPIQYEELSFDRKPLNSSFTYLKALQDSTYVQLLSDVFHEFSDISTPWGSVYSLAKTIVYHYPKYESQFTEILSFLELAEKNNMLEYSCETIETGECSELIPDKIEVFAISIKH